MSMNEMAQGQSAGGSNPLEELDRIKMELEKKLMIVEGLRAQMTGGEQSSDAITQPVTVNGPTSPTGEGYGDSMMMPGSQGSMGVAPQGVMDIMPPAGDSMMMPSASGQAAGGVVKKEVEVPVGDPDRTVERPRS